MGNKTPHYKFQRFFGTTLGILLSAILYGLIAIFFIGFFVLAYFTIFR